MTFYRWTKTVADNGTPVGDFAADVMRDKTAADVPNTYRAWKSHLIFCNACTEALEAFEQAWADYQAECH